MAVKSFKDLFVWQKAMDLAAVVYSITKSLPAEERYSLADQMRRAAISIPSNIAEGQQRTFPKEFYKFLSFAKGSLAELETQLLLCEKLKYLDRSLIQPVLDQCAEVGKMLNGLMNNLQGSSRQSTGPASADPVQSEN